MSSYSRVTPRNHYMKFFRLISSSFHVSGLIFEILCYHIQCIIKISNIINQNIDLTLWLKLEWSRFTYTFFSQSLRSTPWFVVNKTNELAHYTSKEYSEIIHYTTIFTNLKCCISTFQIRPDRPG